MNAESSTADREGGSRSGGLFRFVKRAAIDALVIGLWVVLLTLLFLARVWPRWAYYGLLALGVLAYVGYTGLSTKKGRERRG